MSRQDGKQQSERVIVENVNHPGSTPTVDAEMYLAYSSISRPRASS